MPIAMVMTPLSKMICADPEEPAAQAAPAAYGPRIDCLPVVRKVEEDPKRLQLIGRVSKTNFTRLLVELAEGKGGNYHS